MSRDARDELGKALAHAARTAQRAGAEMDDAVAAFLGINPTDGRAIDVLDQYGEMTAGDLAERMNLTSGAVTAMVDRLERAGLVERTRSTEDRRKVFIQTSERARAVVRAIFQPYKEVWQRHAAQLSEAELAAALTYVTCARDIDNAYGALLRGLQAPGDASYEDRCAAGKNLGKKAEAIHVDLVRPDVDGVS